MDGKQQNRRKKKGKQYKKRAAPKVDKTAVAYQNENDYSAPGISWKRTTERGCKENGRVD